MKNRIWAAILFVVMVSAPHVCFAEDFWQNHRWSIGGQSGIAYGYNTFDTIQDCSGFCGFLKNIVDALTGFYSTIPIMAVADYRFHRHWSVRGGLGMDLYANKSTYYRGMSRVFVAGEALALWHIREKTSLWHPTVGLGLRLPVVNPAVAVGNQFYVTDRVAIYPEVMFNTLPGIDVKLEGRLGVLMRF